MDNHSTRHIHALLATGLTERQAKLVLRFGWYEAAEVDRLCDDAFSRASNAHFETEYMVVGVNRLDMPLSETTYEVVEYDDVGSVEGEVVPIWSSSDGFNFDPDCVCF